MFSLSQLDPASTEIRNVTTIMSEYGNI